MNLHMDLHMHSLYSDDGEFTPETLLQKCSAAGLKTIAITDHNTTLANDAAAQAAVSYGIHYIPGIEIDCMYQNVNFHLLGYQINYKSPDFQEIEDNISFQSQDASHQMLKKTQAFGFHITENDMEKVSQNCYWPNRWTGEMFAEVLLNKEEYLSHPLLAPYRPGGNRSDNPYVNIYWDIYAPGKPCHVPVTFPNLLDMIDLIHQNNGLAVLAHPGQNLKNQESLLTKLIRLPLDGLEAASSYHSSEQCNYYYQQAQAADLKITCGSDYHGKTKPSVFLGKFHTPANLRDEDLLFSL